MLRKIIKNLTVIGSLFLSGPLFAAEESVMNYYLLGGASAVGGSVGGRAVSAGVVYTDCQRSLCSGYAQFVGHTIRKPGVTYFDTMKGYSFLNISGFVGLGIRTVASKKLVGQVTYGFGVGPAILSIRRFTEESRNLSEVAFSVYMPYSFF
jgi:hypothetical protein